MPSRDQESYVQNRRRAAELDDHGVRIQRPNDDFRSTFIGSYVTITAGVRGLGADALPCILQSIRHHEEFESANDPCTEHDFGSFTYRDHQLFWKIDYYDKRLEFGSPDPADPAVTARVITIMLASEY